MFYLITGENTPLIDDAIHDIKNKHANTPFQLLSEKTLFEDFIDNIQACDMFSSQKGVLLKSPKWLSKPSKEMLSTIEITLKLAKNFQIPLVVVIKKIDKRSAIYKLFKKNIFNETTCDEFKDWESNKIEQWVMSYCNKEGVKIEKNAISTLINSYGTSIGIIKQELLKCITTILPKKIMSASDIAFSSGNIIGHYSNLSKSIKKGDKPSIISTIFKLLQLKEDPFKIFNQILFNFNQICPIYLGSKQGLSTEKIASTLGKHPYFVKQLWQDIKQNNLLQQSNKIYGIMATHDYLIKSGKLSPKQALIYFCSLIKHQD